MNRTLRIAVLLAAIAPLATFALLNDPNATDAANASPSVRSLVDAFPTAQAPFAMRRPADRG